MTTTEPHNNSLSAPQPASDEFPANQYSNEPTRRPHKRVKKAPIFASLTFGLVMVAGLAAAMTLSQKSQETRSDASTDNITETLTTDDVDEDAPFIYLAAPRGIEIVNGQYQVYLEYWANLPTGSNYPSTVDYQFMYTDFQLYPGTSLEPSDPQDWDFNRAGEPGCEEPGANCPEAWFYVQEPNPPTEVNYNFIARMYSDSPGTMSTAVLDGNNSPPLGNEPGGHNRLGSVVLNYGSVDPGCVSLTPNPDFSWWTLRDSIEHPFTSENMTGIRVGNCPPANPDLLFAVPNNNNVVTSTIRLDLDANGTNETVAATHGINGSSLIIAYDDNGNQRWQTSINGLINWRAIASGQLDADTNPEIVVSTGSPASIVVLEHDGFVKPGWPVNRTGIEFTAPTLFDVDNDGMHDVIVGFRASTSSTSVLAFNENGQQLWSRVGVGNILNQPVVADLNSDAVAEIVTVGYSSSTTTWSSSLFVTNLNGSVHPLQITIPGERVMAPPVVGNIDNNGSPEILLVSSVQTPDGGKTYAYRSDGQPVPGWPQTTGNVRPGTSGPALADIDADSDLEIFMNNTTGLVHGWHHSGEPLTNWPVSIPNVTPIAVADYPPVVGDINGDGQLDVVLDGENCTVLAISAQTGSLSQMQLDSDGALGCAYIRRIGLDIQAVGAAKLSVGAQTEESIGLAMLLNLPSGAPRAGTWPVFQKDNQRTGWYRSTIPSPTPTRTPTPVPPTPTRTPTPVPPTPTRTPTPTPAAKIVFVTSTTYNGDLDSNNDGNALPEADALCNARAAAGGRPGTYKAWLSTSNVTAASRVANASYRLVNGTVIANNRADLIDGSIRAPINRTELNTVPGRVGSANVWTGTTPYGEGAYNKCVNWTAGTQNTPGGQGGQKGNTASADSNWTQNGSITCNNQAHLYCFQQ